MTLRIFDLLLAKSSLFLAWFGRQIDRLTKRITIFAAVLCLSATLAAQSSNNKVIPRLIGLVPRTAVDIGVP